MDQPDEPQAADPPPKSSFFCPDCGSSGSIENDLLRREESGQTLVCCPLCGSELTRRPDVPPTNSDREPGQPVLEAD